MIFLINNCSDNNTIIYNNINQLIRSIKLKEFLGKSIDDSFFIKYQRMDQKNYMNLLDYKYNNKRIYFISTCDSSINAHIHCLSTIIFDRLDMDIVKSRYDKEETKMFKEIILKDLEKYEKEYN